MTNAALQKKLSNLFPGADMSVQELAKQALLLQLQEVNRKMAEFEGRYNQEFVEFAKSWKHKNKQEKHSYSMENDYLDWEALEEYKRELMKAIHSL